PKVDIVADFEKPLPIENNSFDVVISRYSIEHVSWRTIRNLLKEVVRILKPDGQVIVVTANLKEQARVIASRDKWEGDYESRLVFGDLDYPENSHKCGFSPEYAERLFREVGFQQVKVEPHPQCATDLIIHASKIPPVLDRFTWVRQQIDKLTKDNPNAQILDVGCSDCPITWQLKNCTWVDTESYEKIAKDMQYFGRTPMPREKFVQASAENLPFEQKFDVILLTEILEHVLDPIIVLREASRVAKKAIITCPDEFSWNIKYKPFQNSAHVRHYTEQLLKQQLEEANIKSYEFGKLDYEGWSFFTVVADLPDVKSRKSQEETIEENLPVPKKDTIEFLKESIAQQ
ncbi:MAG: methyltransferase domain-containing protein, partial [Ignavibacteria bacterium]|nr:methyltransferase domain-containing protein [Ignavibacteria bacterium]